MYNEWNNYLNNKINYLKVETIKILIEIGNKEKKCKNCIFYKEKECHGHGEFWGTCLSIYTIISENKEIIYEYNNKQNDINNKITLTDAICFDETNCKFEDFINKLKENVKIE